jgi:RNA polymerase sigma factor (sigma-70 family)
VDDRQLRLLRFATVLTGDPDLADEIEIVAAALRRTGDVWVRVCALGQPDAYIRMMIVSEYVSWRRWVLRRQRTPRRRPAVELVDDNAETADGEAPVSASAALVERLDGLPRNQRAALVLRFYEGLSDDEIADLLGCSPVMVRSEVAYALDILHTREARSDAPVVLTKAAFVAGAAGRVRRPRARGPH